MLSLQDAALAHEAAWAITQIFQCDAFGNPSYMIHPHAFEVLVAALCDENAQVRSSAAAVFPPVENMPKPHGAQVEQLLAAMKDPAPSVRRAASTALLQVDDPRASGVLQKAVKDEDAGVRATALHMLGQRREACVKALLPAALADSAAGVREVALSLCAQYGVQLPVETLATEAKDANPQLRRQAVLSLGVYANDNTPTHAADATRALDALLAETKDVDAAVRDSVLRLLTQVKDPRGLQAVLALLADPDAELRREALSALDSLHETKLLPVFAKALDDTDEQVSGMAMNCIAGLGSAGIDTLDAALKHPTAKVRQQAVIVLRDLHDSRSIPLLSRACKDTDGQVSFNAALALAGYGAEGTKALLALANDPQRETRGLVLAALSSGSDPARIDVALQALQDPDRDNRKSALAILRTCVDPRLAEAMRDYLDAETLTDLRYDALQVLAHQQDKTIISTLLGLLQKKDLNFRLQVAAALNTIGPRIVDPLLAALPAAAPEEVPFILSALGNLDDPRITTILLNYLNDANIDTASLAAQQLVARGKEGLGKVLELANSPNAKQRRMAMSALANSQDPRAVTAMRHAIHDPDPVVRAEALRGIPAGNDPQVMDALLPLLADTDEHVRARAVVAISRQQDPRRLPTLLGLLNAPMQQVRMTAAMMLGEMKDAQSIDPLITALVQSDGKQDAFSTAIVRSLQLITGQKFGNDAAKWRAWRKGQ